MKWIPVEERLPDWKVVGEVTVLAAVATGEMTVDYVVSIYVPAATLEWLPKTSFPSDGKGYWPAGWYATDPEHSYVPMAENRHYPCRVTHWCPILSPEAS